MKRWMWILCGLLAFQMLEKTGSEMETLQPVQLLEVSRQGRWILLRTDTGDRGMGENLLSALQDMQESSRGRIFLETAEQVILKKGTESLVPELQQLLRPAAAVCMGKGDFDLPETAAFLTVHRPDRTMADLRSGKKDLPLLKEKWGKLKLERTHR